MARPKSHIPTIARTYMFFQEDIRLLELNGWTAKEVFKLGILAKKENPQLMNRIKELEENNRLMSEKLTRVARKNYELEEKIKGTGEDEEKKSF